MAKGSLLGFGPIAAHPVATVSIDQESVIANLAVTLGAATLDTTADAAVVADVSKTLDPATLTAIVDAPVEATLAGALANVGIAATATADVIANLDQTLSGAVVTATAIVETQANVEQGLANAGVTAQSSAGVDANLTQTLNATLSAAAAADVEAIADNALGDVSLESATLVYQDLGVSLDQLLESATLAATTTVATTATLANTLLDDATFASAAFVEAMAGINAILAPAGVSSLSLISVPFVEVTSRLPVLNGALALLGQPLAEDENERGEDLTLLRALWTQSVEFACERTGWDHAKRRHLCARLSVKPVFGYRYYYAIPPDCLRILTVSETGDPHDDLIEYEIEGGRIAANVETIAITYLSDVSLNVTGHWPEAFAHYVSCELAFLAAPKLNKNAFANIQVERRKALAEAISLDAAGGPPWLRGPGSWARHAYRPITSNMKEHA